MAPTRNTAIIERLSSVFTENNDKNDENDLLQVCGSIASDIQKRQMSLAQVVEQLGEFLTSTDVSVRDNGVRSLSTIIQELPQDFLNEQELQLLTSFYCDRLKDHHSVIPSVIFGILAIVQMTNLPKDSPAKLLHSLFQHVRCQSELQENRRNIYLIFQNLLKTRMDDLKKIAPDFVYGFISSMDGESDPRNLMLLFTILPEFLKEFPLGHLTEEMFEVIACYFPIDFTSGGKEGKGITREDLSSGLEKCLSALPEFAEFCVPLLLEKFDSTLKIAKLDALSLLSSSCSIFGVEGFRYHLDEFWMLMRRETLPGSDQEVRIMALKALSDVSRVLSGNLEVSERFVEKIIVDTRTSFADVQLSLFWPAERVLEAVARGSRESCAQIAKAVVPLCLGQYSTKTSTADKISLMETLNNFVGIAENLGFRISDIPELRWTDIPHLYLNELQEGETVLKSKALSGLTIQVLSLSETHRKILYNRLCTEIDTGHQDLKTPCHSTLLVYAKNYPKEIEELLQDRLKIDTISKEILQNRLEALSAIARIPELAPEILPLLIDVAVTESSETSVASLSCLQNLLSGDENNSHLHNYLEKDCRAIERLLESIEDRNNERIQLVSSICCLIVRKLGQEAQKVVVDRHFSSLRTKIEDDIVLIEGILTSLVPGNAGSIPIDFLHQLFEISMKGKDEESKLSACRLISTLVNKMKDDEGLGRYLNVLREAVTQDLESENDYENKKAAVLLHTWLTKALVMRGNKVSQDFLDYQVNLLKNEKIGEFAGEKFKDLVDKNEKILTVDNFCTVKIFYKQRIFQNLIRHNENFDDCARQNYLLALSHLVEEISVDLLFVHISKIVPLLIESLSMENSQLLLSTLNTLGHLLDTKHEIFTDQIQSFITRCLKLSTHPKMQIRIAALNCLHSYSNYPTMIIMPYKEDVLDKLSETIDDKKRLVRNVAVKARTKWYLVGAPGGSD